MNTSTPSHTHTVTHPRPSVTDENADEVLAVLSLSHTSTPSHITHPDQEKMLMKSLQSRLSVTHPHHHTPTQSLTLIKDHPSQEKMLMKSLQSRLSVTHPHHHTPTQSLTLSHRPSITDDTRLILSPVSQSHITITHPHSHSP